jgi:hypothetical protein
VKRVVLLLGVLVLAAPAGAAAPARLLVGAREFSLTLSRPSLEAGPAIVQLANYGEDDHNLRLRRVGGTRIYKLHTVASGGNTTQSATLLPGRFRLWCSLGDHAARGMRTTLRVTR